MVEKFVWLQLTLQMVRQSSHGLLRSWQTWILDCWVSLLWHHTAYSPATCVYLIYYYVTPSEETTHTLHFLVLSKSAVKSMNDHNLSIFGSISMKFSL